MTHKCSIYIPTYNRAPFLKRAILSFLHEMKSHEVASFFRLSISDNCSTDETEHLCATILPDSELFEYTRNSSNIGADGNILRCLIASNADYVWVFGDDDYLLPGSLALVMEVLKKHSSDVTKIAYIEERDWRTGESAKFPLAHTSSKVKTQSSTCSYTDSNKILSAFGLHMGHFSTTILKSGFVETWLNTSNKVLFDSGYSQLDWIYKGLKASQSSVVSIMTPCVNVRTPYCQRGKDGAEVTSGFIVLRDSLISYGYNREISYNMTKQQIDATLIAEIKACKFEMRNPYSSLKALFKRHQYKNSLLTGICIFFLPRSLFLFCWVHLLPFRRR